MLYFIDPSNYHLHRNDLNNMYRLRHKVSYEKLKWEVESHNGLEKDEYDEQNMYYLIYKNKENKIMGSLRFIRMSNHCMFDGPFKFSLSNLTDYKNNNYCELSRVVIDDNNDYTEEINQNVYAKLLAALTYLCVNVLNIKHCLAIAYPSVVTLLKRNYTLNISEISLARINDEDITVFSFCTKVSHENIIKKHFNAEYKPVISYSGGHLII